MVSGISEVTDDDGRGIAPSGRAKRAHVGHEMEVAVAERPVGVVVAGNGFHLDVDREEIIAGVAAVGRGVIEEEATVEPLSHEPTVVIGEGDDHRVDLAGFDLFQNGGAHFRSIAPTGHE